MIDRDARIPWMARLLTLGLALLLAASAAVSYPLPLVAEIVGTTLLVVGAAAAGRRLFWRKAGSFPDMTSVFVVVLSAVSTIESLLAQQPHGLLDAIDGTPGYSTLARLFHYLVVVVVVWAGRESSRVVGLGAALVYTSAFYFPTFATPEAGPSFVYLIALAMVLLTTIPVTCHASQLESHVAVSIPLVLFVLLVLIASLLSLAQHDSLVWLLRLLTLVLLAWVIPLSVETRARWKRMAMLVVVMGVTAPVLLSAGKLLELAWGLDGWAAVCYRMGLSELGRANLIARTLLIGVPVLIAQAAAATGRVWRILGWTLSALGLLIFAACQSWGGWIGFGVICVFAGILTYGHRLRAWWRNRLSGVGRYLLFAAVIAVFGAGLLGLLRLAPESNEGSFNGRLFQFRAALREIAHHPLSGIGPANYFAKSYYTIGLDWLVDTQVTLDHPLRPVYHLRGSTALHTHNLFLEIGVGTGLLGLAAFVWFVVALFRYGLRTRARLCGQDRVLLTGCLVGIVASLGWGLLDVMEVSPPFLTFPTWALVGLLLAAPRAFGVGEEPRTNEDGSFLAIRRLAFRPRRVSQSVLQAVSLALVLILATVAVVLPLLGNLYYRGAYTAYQERQWATATEELVRVSRWEPLNAKVYQLRGEALINLGRYPDAITAYERAVRLKRDFAPYHAQLGWLYWLEGDLKQAAVHFQRAVEMDPREAWYDGLHANLGLAYAAQGRIEDAIPLFQESIKLDPQMAGALYWVPASSETGVFEVMLDPVYLDGPLPELEKRILAHLGKADYTPRRFDPDLLTRSSITLGEVLDGIQDEYQVALEEDSRQGPRLLATVAEAARVAGLEDRAERTYLVFQEAFPESSYGFRNLGRLYWEQGRPQEAQVQLEQAVQVSPRDPASWLELAQAYFTGEMLDEAQATLDTVYRQEPLESHLYQLRAQLALKKAETAQATAELSKALIIEESLTDRLRLAELYHQLGDQAQATKQCTKAAEAVFRTWPRPLDPHLWDIGVCLAQSPEDELPKKITALSREHPLIGNVLLGHVYRARGLWDEALLGYQRAADARPDEGAPHYFLGETYQALGQPEMAEVEYRQAVQLDPLESLPWLALGQMQWRQGEHEAALESFQAAVEVTPGWGPAHVALGNALLALGDREGAAEHYQLAQIADGDVHEGLIYALAAHLAEAGIESLGPEYVRNDYFTIGGEERRVLFMHPDSRASYRLALPTPPSMSGRTEGGLTLAFDLATAPESWEQPGDGVTFAIYVEFEQGTEQVFSTYIDPKQDEADRRWHAYTIDLGAYMGQAITLILETGAGPAGDSRFDWAGWGAPRLLAP
jgi:tetratricopeptide (TPR) repeat protein/O-antigen ligase